MTKICTQTNVAEVDNSAVACEKFISTDCIVHAEAVSYLGLLENSTMTEVFAANLLSLIDVRNRTVILETKTAKKVNGFLDYNDLTTATTPISITGGSGYNVLTNDAQGAFTNTAYPPEGVTKIWDGTTNRFDFSELTLGSKVEIRLDLEVTTTSPNTAFDVALELAVGGSPYTISWTNSFQKAAGIYKVVVSSFIYVGDDNTRNNPAYFKIQSDLDSSVKVTGWACYINLY